MKRYFTRPKQYIGDIEPVFYVDADEPPLLSNITVHELDGVNDTGLLDERGDPIYTTNRITLGFIK